MLSNTPSSVLGVLAADRGTSGLGRPRQPKNHSGLSHRGHRARERADLRRDAGCFDVSGDPGSGCRPVGLIATIGDPSRPWLVNRNLGVAVLVIGSVCLLIAGAIA